MCNPIAVVTAVAFISAAAQQADARAQAGQQNELRKTNASNATQAALDQYNQQGLQAEQGREVATQSATENTIAAARARASAQASAADSGLSGLSVDALIHGIDNQESANRDTIGINQAYAAQQRSLDARGIAANAQSRINSVAPGYFNPFTAGLAIAGQTLSAYSQAGGFDDLKKPKEKPSGDGAKAGGGVAPGH